MYEIGKVYFWRNQVGPMACLNGTECTVESVPAYYLDYTSGTHILSQMTDSRIMVLGRRCVCFAEKGDLIPKESPSGEQSILSLFDQPVLETA